jgi:hypothetical protein
MRAGGGVNTDNFGAGRRVGTDHFRLPVRTSAANPNSPEFQESEQPLTA